ncbi:MAG: hypothetical protein WC460_06745 [Patescibacteria group bacterium]
MTKIYKTTLSEVKKLLNEQKIGIQRPPLADLDIISPDDIINAIDKLIMKIFKADLPPEIKQQVLTLLRQANHKLDAWLQQYYDEE